MLSGKGLQFGAQQAQGGNIVHVLLAGGNALAGNKIHINLEKAVGRTSIAQALDSLGYMKKMLITNKVTTHFFITPFKSTSYTLHALPTAFSRINHTEPHLELKGISGDAGSEADST